MKKFVEKNSPEKLLDKLDIRPTRARLNLLYETMSRTEPFSSDDLLDSLLGKGIGRTTIFTNMVLFKEKGILREVDIRRDSIFYEYNGNNHHHHLVCVECGCIEDFQICGAERLIKDVLKQSKNFTNITDHSFELFGLCGKCSH